MTDEMENLIGKLREIEEQAGHAVTMVALTAGRGRPRSRPGMQCTKCRKV
jgi:hypothetical protein